MSEPLLDVRDLRVSFATPDGLVRAVDGVSFSVAPGRTLGIVGESGSGKSVAVGTVMGLTRGARGATIAGELRFGGRDLTEAGDEELRRLRGNELAMVFQDPMSSLHPLFRVGDQLVEAVRAHRPVGRRAARIRAQDMLGLAGVPEPGRRMEAYPHELSGGLRQRVMIAMALVNEPRLLIADEPTTALDVTVQAQILELLARLRDELGMAMVLVTHDLGVVARVADDVAVMYAGRIVETGPTRPLLRTPQHPYTWGLLRSMPRLDGPRDAWPVPIAGRPPSPIAPPSGCRFHPRCPSALAPCAAIDPVLQPAGDGTQRAACILPAAVREAERP